MYNCLPENGNSQFYKQIHSRHVITFLGIRHWILRYSHNLCKQVNVNATFHINLRYGQNSTDTCLVFSVNKISLDKNKTQIIWTEQMYASLINLSYCLCSLSLSLPLSLSLSLFRCHIQSQSCRRIASAAVTTESGSGISTTFSVSGSDAMLLISLWLTLLPTATTMIRDPPRVMAAASCLVCSGSRLE